MYLYTNPVFALYPYDQKAKIMALFWTASGQDRVCVFWLFSFIELGWVADMYDVGL